MDPLKDQFCSYDSSLIYFMGSAAAMSALPKLWCFYLFVSNKGPLLRTAEERHLLRPGDLIIVLLGQSYCKYFAVPSLFSAYGDTLN